MAYTIIAARLPLGDVPVCGVTVEPYIQLRRLDTNQTAQVEELPEESSEGDAGSSRYVLRSLWSRSVVQGRAQAYCSIHPEREAGLQCTLCLRAKHAIPTHKSYHCSVKCFTQHWRVHKEMHERAEAQGECPACHWTSPAGPGRDAFLPAVPPPDPDLRLTCFDPLHRYLGYIPSVEDSNGFRGSTYSNGGETWLEVPSPLSPHCSTHSCHTWAPIWVRSYPAQT